MLVQATISMLGTEDGGRRGPVFSGYRPQFYYAQADWECRSIDFGRDQSVEPGESAEATIILSANATTQLANKLQIGDLFEIREGARVVARGLVTGLPASTDATSN